MDRRQGHQPDLLAGVSFGDNPLLFGKGGGILDLAVVDEDEPHRRRPFANRHVLAQVGNRIIARQIHGSALKQGLLRPERRGNANRPDKDGKESDFEAYTLSWD